MEEPLYVSNGIKEGMIAKLNNWQEVLAAKYENCFKGCLLVVEPTVASHPPLLIKK